MCYHDITCLHDITCRYYYILCTDSVVFIWKLSEASGKADGNLLEDSDSKENWTAVKTLR